MQKEIIKLADIDSPELDESVGKLANDIRLRGILEPIVVERIGDRFKILSGTRRVAACKLIGLTEIPARVYEGLTTEQREGLLDRGQTRAVKTWAGDKPAKCDVCEKPIGDCFADAVIPHMGVWGIICPACCTEFKVKIGTGRGQVYKEAIIADNNKREIRFIKVQG